MSFSREERPDLHAARRRAILLAGTALALAAAGAIYFLFRRAPKPGKAATAPAPSPPSGSRPAAPRPALPSANLPPTGSLEVSANVEGATVYLDGERVGDAPYWVEQVPPGGYRLRVEKPGYQPFEQAVRVRRGIRSRVRAQLTAAASLKIGSDVPGASVFLDRNYVGTAPVEVKDITPGSHQLTVSAEGFPMYAEEIELSAEARQISVTFREVRLEEAIQVVHKHTFGSCEGRLLATPAGLRYETSRRQDVFTAPLSSLELFEVDYPEKELQIKLRRGKTYNFSEKANNADLLYTFHQRVEEARKRLSASAAARDPR